MAKRATGRIGKHRGITAANFRPSSILLQHFIVVRPALATADVDQAAKGILGQSWYCLSSNTKMHAKIFAHLLM